MNLRRLPVLGLALLLALAACAPTGRRGGEPLPDQRVQVNVRNNNFNQATIYAVLNTSRIRLGEVSGNSEATFSSPSPVSGQMQIEVRLLAVGSYTSFPVQVVRGDQVRITVPANLHHYRGNPR